MLKASIIIPTLNEVETIEKILTSIPKEERIEEVLVVDGHSTDGTIDIVKRLGFPLVFQEKKGFGSAIATGIKESKGEVIIILNADNSHDPNDIPKLLDKIEEGYDMVMASRYLPGAGSEDDTLLHYIGNRLLTFFCNKFHGANFSDCLYFFFVARRSIFDSINMTSSGFEYCMELPIKIHKGDFKIAEIPSFERKRWGGKAKVNSLIDGWKIFRAIFKY